MNKDLEKELYFSMEMNKDQALEELPHGLGKRKRNNEDTNLCLEINNNNRSSDEMGDCPLWQSKHKIFLSHSGAQKDFVEGLCEDLENSHRFPFFDKRPSSLPKGERFPELILEAAQHCEMAVVVVSKEYFTSKWPMIELNAFIQAKLVSNLKLKILPLFFGMSVKEFHNISRQGQWFSEWEKWAKNDTRIDPMKFQNAVNMLRSFNGIEFNQDMREVGTYRRIIISTICSIIPPDVKWDDSHIQGRSNLCQVIREKIENIEPSRKHGIITFGFYGMGGIGKTTMCKMLCNELSEFHGKTCHIELGTNQSSEESLKEVLKKLTNTNKELLQNLKEGECRNILWNTTCWRQKTFLAIDNVWDDSKSIEQVKMFLSTPFYKGSIVMLTSRCQSTLAHLQINESHRFEMPELGEIDAKNLFLYHAAKGEQFDCEKDHQVIKECILHCYFKKSEEQGFHYLPLALKILGMHLGCLGNNPTDWLKNLSKVKDFNYFFPDENPVFSIIRLNYDRLQIQEQALFMDLAIFNPTRNDGGFFECNKENDLLGWLSLVHKQKLEDTKNQVQRLKEKGLLEDVNISSQKVSIHDLYCEFAKMESQGKFLKSRSFKNRRWIYEHSKPIDLDITPSGRCWENLVRIGIENSYDFDEWLEWDDANDDILSLQGIEWRYFSNVVVLQLVGLSKMKGHLTLKGMRCLRSLELEDLGYLHGVEGLENLNNLTYFQWMDSWECTSEVTNWQDLGILPVSLQVLLVCGVGVYLRRHVLTRCTNLRKLNLAIIRVDGGIDFSQCTSLQSIHLCQIQGLEKLFRVGVTGLTTCLQSLDISLCYDLYDVSGLDHLICLQYLELWCNNLLEELPDLQKLTNLQILKIEVHDDLSSIGEVRGLGSLQQLRELIICGLNIIEVPNLSGFKQLHHLELEFCKKLPSLREMGDLATLQHFDLRGCSLLLRLPNLKNFTALKELHIGMSGIELQEEDIQMLGKLPMLGLVKIRYGYGYDIMLDCVRRKVIKQGWSGRGKEIEEERDLEPLPIKVYQYQF